MRFKNILQELLMYNIHVTQAILYQNYNHQNIMSNEENQSRIKFINCKSVIFITIYEDITRDLRNILQ